MRTRAHALLKYLTTTACFGLMAACADYSTAAPKDGTTYARSTASLASELSGGADSRFPDLGLCQDLQVPAGSKVTFHVFGIGFQIYRWTGASWVFVNPSADLFADAGGQGLVGKHFGGPTWRTVSGSQMVGTIAPDGRCSLNNPSAIPWLKLTAVASGSGVFSQTTFIQRTNTAGGLAPSAPGSVAGEEVNVPYTADYYFYRNQ